MSCRELSFYTSMACLLVVVLPATLVSFVVTTVLIAVGGFGDSETRVLIAFASAILAVMIFVAVSIVRYVRARPKARGVSLESLSPEKEPLIEK